MTPIPAPVVRAPMDLSKVQIRVEWPPNIDEIDGAFDVRLKMRRGIIGAVFFAHGQSIYNPCNARLSKALLVHEATHLMQQQTIAADKWWRRYIEEPRFRLEQEQEAHVNEYLQAVRDNNCRQSRRANLTEIAKRLSGPLYGGMLKLKDAKALIQAGAAA